MKRFIISALICGIAFSAHAQRTISFMSSAKEKAAKIIQLKPVDIISARIYKKQEFSLPVLPASFSETEEAFSPEIYDFSADTVIKDSIRVSRKTDTTEIKVGRTRIVIIGEPKIDRIYVDKDSVYGDYHDEDDEPGDDEEEEKQDFIDVDGPQLDLGFLYTRDNGSPTESIRTLKQQLELDNGRSLSFTLYLVNMDLNLYRRNVNFHTGIGLEYNNYHFRKNITVVPRTDSFQVINETVELSKNKLLSRYIVVPALLHLQTNKIKNGNRFFAAGGVEFGYFIGGRSKQVSDDKGKVKVEDDFNFRRIKYNLVARAGYGDWSVFAKMPLDELKYEVFEDDQVPGLSSMSFGLSLNF